MNLTDKFIAKTVKGFLIVAGLATCMPILIAINLPFSAQHLFSGLLDYTAASVPALRHWGIMVFGIGVLMVAAAFRPHLRFETFLFSTVEKAFMVFLYLESTGQPWANAYVVAFVIDLTISLYGIVYFMSSEGRPQRWKKESEGS